MCQSLINSRFKTLCFGGIILLFIASALTGCAEQLTAPVLASHITLNQISTEEISVYSNGEPREEEPPLYYEYDQMSPEQQKEWQGKEILFSGNYIQIDGLKDKKVQEKINEKIKQLYLDNIDFIPPYRGIKAKLGEDPYVRQDTYSSMAMYVEGNFNNILSLTLNCNMVFSSAESEEHTYVAWSVPLNIDLNTGEDITLNQIFRDHVDGIEYLNNYFSEFTSDTYGEEQPWLMGDEIMLIGRFDTFETNQKFSVSPYGIKLILDYETPAVYTEFYPQMLMVPYGEKMALLERFFDEDKNIYTANESPEKNLLIPDIKMDEKIETSKSDDGISVYRSATYSKEMPEALKNRMKDLYNEDYSDAIEEIRPYYKEALLEYGKQNAYGESRRMIVYDVFGDFASIRIYEYDYVGGSDGSSYKDFYSQQSTQYEVYDLKAGEIKPMQLKDIFVEGADIEALIKGAITDSINTSLSNDSENNNIREGTYVFGEGENKEKDAQYVDEIYDAINGFGLQQNSIMLLFDENPEDIYKEVYDVTTIPERNAPYVYAIDNLSYGYIDSRTMTIFR